MPHRPLFFTTPVLNEREEDCRSAERILFANEPAAQLDDCKADGFFTPHWPRAGQALFIRTPGVYQAPLPHGFQLVYSPYAPGGPTVLNPAGWHRWQQFSLPRLAAQEIDRLLAEQMLIIPPGTTPQPASAPADTLTCWLHITNACNLDCPYCYIRKSSERMSEEIGLTAIETIFHTAEQHGFRRVKLKYAGGEATLHFKLVRRLHEFATQLAAGRNIQLSEVLLTNGVSLRPADAAWLAGSGFKVMISLDGVGQWHDRLRSQRNGVGTFQAVEHTVDHVLASAGIRPDIAMTVTGTNAMGTADLVCWALVERKLPLSLNFYRPTPLSASRAELNLEENVILEGMLAAYQLLENNLPTEPFLDGLLDRVQIQAHSHTCGVGRNYLVIGHDGRLAQCQMHLQQPVSQLAAGRDLLPMVAQGPIQNISVDNREQCKQCEFRYRCTGGCPLETYRATGRWDVKSPHCRLIKTLLPAALRLEGLRLMKVHGYLQ